MDEMLSFRHNVMDVSSIRAFAGIKGGVNRGCKDVYFVRMTGGNASLCGDVAEMDEMLCRRMREGKGAYRRIAGLPKLASVEDAGFYADCYAGWIESGKERICTRVSADDTALQRMLGRALAETVRRYESGGGQENHSMEKNFAVKLLYWFDFVAHGLLPEWDVKQSVKIAAENIVKKQEYLFFYMLTLVGIDVLLLQCEADIGETDEKTSLSKKYVLGSFVKCSLPAFEPSQLPADERGSAAGQSRTGGVRIARPVKPVSSAAAQNVQPAACSTASAQNTNAKPGGPVRIHLPERRNTRPGKCAKAAGQTSAGGQSAGQLFAGPQEPVRVQMPARTRMPAGQGAASSGVRREKSFEELARLASSVVLIAIHDDKGEVVGTGSGIMIGRAGYLLTNHHVASGGRYYSVRVEEDEKVYRTDEIIKYNSVLDLAVIRIDRTLNPIPVYRGPQKLVRGQKVVAIGSPLGLFNSVSDGIISGFRVVDDVDMIQFTAPISRGSSGGAVLNLYGEVIGISTAGMDAGQNLNLAVGYECINMFIKGFV